MPQSWRERQAEALDGDEEGPGEHDAHLLDDDPVDTVPCPCCGKFVHAQATGCRHCHSHFAVEAWRAQSGQGPGHFLSWRVILVILLLLVFSGALALLRLW